MAIGYLNRVWGIMKESSLHEEEQDMRALECGLNTVLFDALTDHPELARELLDRIMRDHPDDETAKEILSALR